MVKEEKKKAGRPKKKKEKVEELSKDVSRETNESVEVNVSVTPEVNLKDIVDELLRKGHGLVGIVKKINALHGTKINHRKIKTVSQLYDALK